MIKRVGTISIFVADQDRALNFYTKKLGFTLRTDQPLFPGSSERWIAVAPEGGKTEILLYLADENWSHYRDIVGKPQAITLEIDNIEATVADLQGKGVRFLGEIDHMPWGAFATFLDSEGNSLVLME